MKDLEIINQLSKLLKDKERLENLLKSLNALHSIEEKIALIGHENPQSAEYFEKYRTLTNSENEEYLLACVLAIGQESVISEEKKAFKALMGILFAVETLYQPIGGVIGYHKEFLNCLIEKEIACKVQGKSIEKPPGIDLEDVPRELNRAVKSGILTLNKLAEIYPIGGAADRLDLRDEATGEPLPAAELDFLGYTLLARLIRDLEAREYLHYKFTKKRISVPIVMMTSSEKNNHDHILSILEKNDWFGRKKTNHFLINQPSVPQIGEDGQWVTHSSGHLSLKPGGHGVIWQLAETSGAFHWLKKKKKTHLIARQINNPAAGLDHLLLSFAGYGAMKDRWFGFASCERKVNSAEGMNVLIKQTVGKETEYKITNIEYTDFEQEGIQDEPRSKGESYSCYPANTNILFANLSTIQKALKKNPFPGLLINLKNSAAKKHSNGETSEIAIGRLESIMQNIADVITCKKIEDLPTYLLYYKRIKTISAIKKTLKKGAPLLETPEGGHLDHLLNGAELLRLCNVSIPAQPTESDPTPFLFNYHPALGPQYAIIAQKIRKGKLHKYAELNLDIACLNWENVELNGSLCIEADSPLGHRNKNGETLYSDQEGKCTLLNVKIENAGVDYKVSLPLWKDGLARNESLKIHIQGNGEFYAENITFKGPHELFVPDGYKMICSQEGKIVNFQLEKIEKPSWRWSYSFGTDDAALLALTF